MTSQPVKRAHDLLVSYNPQGGLLPETVQKITALFPKEGFNLAEFPTSRDLIKHYLELDQWENSEAVEMFLKVYINEEPILDLSGCKNKVTVLPPTIRYLAPHLTTLNVSGHQLTTLPEEIGELQKLRSLRAAKNQLTHLPNISNLDALEELDVSHNRLQALPNPLFRTIDKAAQDSSFGYRDRLSLNFSFNWIAELPPDIFSMQCLTFLNVQSNKLTDFPEDPDWPILGYFNAKDNPRSDSLV